MILNHRIDVLAYNRMAGLLYCHAAGEFPGDPRLAALVGELSIGSRRFSELWAAAKVSVRGHGPLRFHHPAVGPITLHQERFTLPDGSGQELITLAPGPDSSDQDALRLLAGLGVRGTDQPGPSTNARTSSSAGV